MASEPTGQGASRQGEASSIAHDQTLLADEAMAQGAADTMVDSNSAPFSGLTITMQPACESGQAREVTLQELARTTHSRPSVLPGLDKSGGQQRLVLTDKPRYQTQQALGEGASGEVLLALDADIQRMVAVKRLKEENAPSESLLRFVDEIRMVGALEHPNIVPIHDVGLDQNGQYFFIMKYVEGETLESIITNLMKGDAEYHRKYTFDYRVSLFVEILKAMEFAHAQGVIHRDIKPANVMIGPHGEVMVMDWGIAKRITKERPDGAVANAAGDAVTAELSEKLELADSGQSTPVRERMYQTTDRIIVGTPAYMSPEQVRGDTDLVDERSDVYCLCAMLYELLALDSYLEPKTSIKDLLIAVLNEKPRSPLFIRNPHQGPVPAQYIHFIMKGLRKDPAERYQTVTEMRDLLQRLSEGYIPVQCPITFTKRGMHGALHFVDKHPMVTFASLCGGALVILGGGGYLVTSLLGLF